MAKQDTVDDLDVAVAGVMARQYAEGSKGFLASLAWLLEQALPGEAELTRKGLFGGAKRPLTKLVVTLGETKFTLEAPERGPLVATKTQIVRGIALKNETIPVEEWIIALSAGIAARAETSKAAHNALASLLR